MRGIDGIAVKLKFDENQNIQIDKIVDANELSADEKTDKAHNDAINLVYSADGVMGCPQRA